MNEKDASHNDRFNEMEVLIADYHILHHHPLAASIEQTELVPLAQALQSRFAQTGVKLNGPADAVVSTREAATAYARQAAQAGVSFTDEDHLRIMREIAAYIGLMYLRLSKGTWIKGECLLEVSVGEERRMELYRGTEHKTVTRMTISMGFMSADLWELAFTGSDEPLDLCLTIYVERPDGYGEWEKPRVRLLFDGDENSFPSAWKATGL